MTTYQTLQPSLSNAYSIIESSASTYINRKPILRLHTEGLIKCTLDIFNSLNSSYKYKLREYDIILTEDALHFDIDNFRVSVYRVNNSDVQFHIQLDGLQHGVELRYDFTNDTLGLICRDNETLLPSQVGLALAFVDAIDSELRTK